MKTSAKLWVDRPTASMSAKIKNINIGVQNVRIYRLTTTRGNADLIMLVDALIDLGKRSSRTLTNATRFVIAATETEEYLIGRARTGSQTKTKFDKLKLTLTTGSFRHSRHTHRCGLRNLASTIGTLECSLRV